MNRLKEQKSLYLLQHANNPVHWFPYGEEAFERARIEGKVILISVGYSSCHWCHVMEKEVFENEAAARLMNENFICIKVDREERPDVDHYLMENVQALGQRGGWPLNCFLTPEGKFFFGATYFPLHKWIKLLTEIIRIFKNERHLLEEQVAEIEKRKEISLKSFLSLEKENFRLSDEMLQRLFSSFDLIHGGLKGSPKFPMPCFLSLVCILSTQSEFKLSSDFIALTLRQIKNGGIYDQLNGGFFRYSVDEKWVIPHFEKMLYDNALLLNLYAETALALGIETEFETVKGILEFLEKWMKLPDGGYSASIDADNAMGEGHYYIFSEEELREATGEKYPVFRRYFRIEEDSYLEGGRFVLRAPLSINQNNGPAISEGFSKEDVFDVIEKLKVKQRTRPQPPIDTKVVVSWNGMLLYGLLKAWKVSLDKEIYEMAAHLALFLKHKAIDAQTKMVFHVIYDGAPSVPGFLEDYAWLALSFLTYYCASGESEYLELGLSLLDAADNSFRNAEGKLLFSNIDIPPMNERITEIFDNVTPSPNSVYCRALILAGKITGNYHFFEKADNMLGSISYAIEQHPAHMANWILAGLERSDKSGILKVPRERLYDAYAAIKEFRNPRLIIIPQEDSSEESLYQLCTTEACLFVSPNFNEILVELNKWN